MKEQEWMACADPIQMLRYLHDKVSERIFRLFACAVCRRLLHLPMIRECHRAAIEVTERYVDGLVGWKDLRSAHFALASHNTIVHASLPDATVTLAFMATTSPTGEFFHPLILNGVYCAGIAATQEFLKSNDAFFNTNQQTAELAREQHQQANILRELVGPGLFHAVKVNPEWLTWNRGAIEKIAQRIYDERSFVNLAILADALEEAGCIDTEILDHCRKSVDHVRGCWVVDRCLNKGAPADSTSNNSHVGFVQRTRADAL